MKNIKNIMATGLMVAVLMVGTSFAKNGMLLSDFAGGNQCQQNASDNGGIIIGGFTGIIIGGFTGIIIGGLNSSTETNRNQTVACRNGMLLSD